MHRLLAACVFLALCRGQEGSLATFGTTVIVPGGLTGKVYHIPYSSDKLPKFERLEAVGTIYTKGVFIPLREFSEGFPGITDRIEWFALDFTGRIYIDNPGSYLFNLCSDDGSKLYIDGKTVINNDGLHGLLCAQNSVKLAGGIHTIRLSYFQGPRYHLSLMLSVAGPKDKQFRAFNTDEFQPPANPAEWKYGSPETLKPPPDPDAGRVRLKDVLRKSEPVVTIAAQVLAGGNAVGDLRRGDFVVRDGGEPQEITDVAFAAQPLDVVLLIEATPAMVERRAEIKATIARALGQLDPRDRVGVVLFAAQQLLLLDLATERTLIATAAGKTQMLPGAPDVSAAVGLTAHYLRQHARPEAMRAIVLVAGERGGSEVSDRVVRDALWQTKVTLCGGESVRAFVDASGGEAIEAPGAAFAALRSRYRIAWRAPGGASKSIRKITVELSGEARAKNPEATIRVPAAYVVE